MDKKKKIAIAASAAAVAVIIGAVAITQGARLKTAASVAKSATMGEEQVTAKADENAQITQELQDQYQIPEIALTPEMEAAIADGSMTLEEAASQFLSGGAQASGTESASETENAAQASESEAETPNPASDAQSAPETSQPPATQTPEPSQPKTPEPEKPVEPEKPTETPAAKPSEPEPETASLSGETDAGQTEASKADSGQTQAPKANSEKAETPKSNGEQSEAPKADAGQAEASNADSGQTQAPEKSAAEKAKEEQDAKVQNLFAQLYVLKNSFSNRVDAIINECIQEFLALDPSKQTRMAKIRLVYARMDDFEAMEADCNAQVESIAAQLDEIDPALGEKARQYYQNEKELKKSSLISQYGG